MNYKKVYDSIIEKRKLDEPQDCYTEVHHIVPKSLGGSDDKDNLVKLTAREHFICHYLLAKMYDKESVEWYKMNHAFMMMKCNSYSRDRYFNSRLYESLRCNFSSLMSFVQSGKRNSQYGKVRCVPIDAVDCKYHVGYFPNQIPEGWITTKEWKKNKRNIKDQYNFEQLTQYYNKLFDIYMKSGYKGVVESTDYNKSQNALIDALKKYVPGFKPRNFRRYSSTVE